MSNEALYPVTGRCQCGQVSYEVSKPPITTIVCHCTECQKLSASAFSMTMVLPGDAITFNGELKTWERSSDSGNLNRAYFCPNCGNRIYHIDPAKPQIIKLKPGTLDNTDIIEPSAHVWVQEKQNWVTIPEGTHCFETQPEQ